MQLWKNTALTSVAALLGLFLLPLAVAREPAEAKFHVIPLCFFSILCI